MICLLVVVLSAVAVGRPVVIGVVTTPNYGDMPIIGHHHILDDYPRWLMDSGIELVPIHYDLPRRKILGLLKEVNGVLISGKWISGDEVGRSRVYSTYKTIVDYSMNRYDKYGEVFPVIGVCLGFEFMVYRFSGEDGKSIEFLPSEPQLLTLEPTVDTGGSRVFDYIPKDLRDWMESVPVSYHMHNHSTLYSYFLESKELKSSVRAVYTSTDPASAKKILSLIEHRKYPFYATAYNPGHDSYLLDSLHTYKSRQLGFILSWFVKSEATKNEHTFGGDSDVSRELMEYYPTFTINSYSGASKIWYFDKKPEKTTYPLWWSQILNGDASFSVVLYALVELVGTLSVLYTIPTMTRIKFISTYYADGQQRISIPKKRI